MAGHYTLGHIYTWHGSMEHIRVPVAELGIYLSRSEIKIIKYDDK
jgi:hypothetical protein